MAYGTIDTSDAESAGIFAIPALFITLRETLEAAIIVSVLLGLLDKLGRPGLKRFVWLGVLAGSAVSLLLAVIFIVIINLLKESFIDGESQHLVEGVLSIVASILVAVVATTIGDVMDIQKKWEKKLTAEVEGEGDAKNRNVGLTRKSIIFLSFTAVLREGMETIIFFAGIGSLYPAKSLPLPAVVGAIVGTILGVLLYKFGGRLSIQIFFKFTMVLLVFIGAGIFTIGIGELQRIGTFGTWEPEEQRSQMLQEVYNIEHCCALEKSEFWVMMRVLFGYSPNPTGVEMVAYFGYHIVVWLAIYFRKPIKASKARLKERMKAKCCGKKAASNTASTSSAPASQVPVAEASVVEDPYIVKNQKMDNDDDGDDLKTSISMTVV